MPSDPNCKKPELSLKNANMHGQVLIFFFLEEKGTNVCIKESEKRQTRQFCNNIYQSSLGSLFV